MSVLRIRGPANAIRGCIRLPGDKSLAHRWLMLAPVGTGNIEIANLPMSLDVQATFGVVHDCGAKLQLSTSADKDVAVVSCDGLDLYGLTMPKASLDCKNSGTTMRLMAGLLSGQRFGARLVGDASLQKRPMRRVIEPLRERGAMIAGSALGSELTAPIHIAPLLEGEALRALEVALPIASAQVKSALLLSGLYASGPTMVSEPFLSRDHTERMLTEFGVPLERIGSHVVLDTEGWDRTLRLPAQAVLPGDPSSAAYFVALATLTPQSQLQIAGLLNNPTRVEAFSTMAAMGANIRSRPGIEQALEPTADYFVRGDGVVRGVTVGGEQSGRMVDELPVLAAMAAFAPGPTALRDARELRVKESDRLRGTVELLRAFGADVVELDDGILVHGGHKLRAARVASHSDHRLAMTAAVVAACVEGESYIEDAECIDVSFPGFLAMLQSLGVDAMLSDT